MNYLEKYKKYKFKYLSKKQKAGTPLITPPITPPLTLPIIKVYSDLLFILINTSENEVKYDDKNKEESAWKNRLCSSFLLDINLYNWNSSMNYEDIICSYTYTCIQDLLKIIENDPIKSIKKFKKNYEEKLNKLKQNIKNEQKFCALYGAPILFTDGKTEPHAYIIYKDANSDKLYVYNGRGKLMINCKDVANEHIQYSWDESEIKISPIDIAIQSYADGLSVDKNGNITKKENYKGLCYPVVVVCAYLFMKSNVTFKEVIQYLYSKKPEELSTLFLKMNNHLVNTVIDDGYW